MAINQDDFIRTALRLPRELHASIQAAADKSGRSMNAEIIERLKASYAVPDDVVAACLKNPDVEDRFEFAVRVLQKAGVNVNIPTDDQL